MLHLFICHGALVSPLIQFLVSSDLLADSEGPDQAAQIRRLILVLLSAFA